MEKRIKKTPAAHEGQRSDEVLGSGAMVRQFSDGKFHVWCPAHHGSWMDAYYKPRSFATEEAAQQSADAHDREHHGKK